MADQKATQLTAAASVTDDDLFYMVDSPGTTPASRKVTALVARSYFGAAAAVSYRLEDYGGVADDTTDNLAAWNSMIAAIPARGGRVHARGQYYFSGGLNCAKPIVLEGDGAGWWAQQDPALDGGTKFRFAAGVKGLHFTVGAQGSVVRNLHLEGGNPTGVAGTADGITVQCMHVSLENLQVDTFSRDGVAILSGTGINADFVQMTNVRCGHNRRDGFHLEGIDSNVCTLIQCDGTANARHNFHNGASTTVNRYFNCHASSGGTADFYENGAYSMYIGCYSEGAGPFICDTNGVWMLWDQPTGYANPAFTFNGSSRASAMMRTEGGWWGGMGLRVHRESGPGGGKTYNLRSGVVAANVFDIYNETDGVSVFSLGPGPWQGGTVPTNLQTASYTLVLTDGGKAIEMNVATANTVTVPPNSSVAFPIGTVIEVYQHGAGATSIAAGAGVTIRSRGGDLTLAAQYSSATLRKRASDEWVLAGDL